MRSVEEEWANAQASRDALEQQKLLQLEGAARRRLARGQARAWRAAQLSAQEGLGRCEHQRDERDLRDRLARLHREGLEDERARRRAARRFEKQRRLALEVWGRHEAEARAARQREKEARLRQEGLRQAWQQQVSQFQQLGHGRGRVRAAGAPPQGRAGGTGAGVPGRPTPAPARGGGRAGPAAAAGGPQPPPPTAGRDLAPNAAATPLQTACARAAAGTGTGAGAGAGSGARGASTCGSLGGPSPAKSSTYIQECFSKDRAETVGRGRRAYEGPGRRPRGAKVADARTTSTAGMLRSIRDVGSRAGFIPRTASAFDAANPANPRCPLWRPPDAHGIELPDGSIMVLDLTDSSEDDAALEVRGPATEESDIYNSDSS